MMPEMNDFEMTRRLEGEFTLSEVSYKVEFEDPFYFSKCFKAHFDCTPKNYKNNI